MFKSMFKPIALLLLLLALVGQSYAQNQCPTYDTCSRCLDDDNSEGGFCFWCDGGPGPDRCVARSSDCADQQQDPNATCPINAGQIIAAVLSVVFFCCFCCICLPLGIFGIVVLIGGGATCCVARASETQTTGYVTSSNPQVTTTTFVSSPQNHSEAGPPVYSGSSANPYAPSSDAPPSYPSDAPPSYPSDAPPSYPSDAPPTYPHDDAPPSYGE